MMIFTVHDSKAEAFLPPFYAQTKGLAIRSFQQAANQEGHDFNRYAGDYTLFLLGDFDEKTAGVTLLPSPESMGLAIQYRQVDPTREIHENGNT